MMNSDFGLGLLDKHLGNSQPHLVNGTVAPTNCEKLYGALPVSVATLQAGLHPLTQPGVTIPYFYDFNSAMEHALNISAQAGGTVGGMQIGITCLMSPEYAAPNLTPYHPVLVGTGTLPRADVAQVYTTVRNPETNETHTFDTTGLSAAEYKTIIACIASGTPIHGLQQLDELRIGDKDALSCNDEAVPNSDEFDDIGDDVL